MRQWFFQYSTLKLQCATCLLVNYFWLNMTKYHLCCDTWYISALQAFVTALGQCAYEFFTRTTRIWTFSDSSRVSDYSPRRYLAPLHIDLFQLYLTALHWQRPVSFIIFLHEDSVGDSSRIGAHLLIFITWIFNPLQRCEGLGLEYKIFSGKVQTYIRCTKLCIWCSEMCTSHSYG